MMEGEILIAEGKLDDGLGQLGRALALENALKNDEPRAWMIPVRHSMGANLLKAGPLPKPSRCIAKICAVCPITAGHFTAWPKFAPAGQGQSRNRRGRCPFSENLGKSRSKNHQLLSLPAADVACKLGRPIPEPHGKLAYARLPNSQRSIS